METLFAAALPLLLKEITHPPQKLYMKGAALSDELPHIAIVGTRLPSRYGEKMAYEIARAIAEAGAVVVSGLAFGVDAIAHKAALDAGRPTIAVLASGVERVTPESHTGLAQKILAGSGTLLSEYEVFDSAHKYRFLERNRLISGLCKATIIIEAKEKSGALITARHAFDQNRDVFALMGDIDRAQSQGCLNLLKADMARPIVSVEKLLDDLGLKSGTEEPPLTAHESSVLELLKRRSLSAQQIVSKTGLDPSSVNIALTTLEIEGLVERNRKGNFKRKSRQRDELPPDWCAPE